MSETAHTTENRDYTVEGMTCSHCAAVADAGYEVAA
jgi:hypothetical protein